MDPIPLPAPYGGVKENIPILAVEAPFCENMLNFNLNQAGAVLRNGDDIIHFTTASTKTRTLLIQAVYGIAANFEETNLVACYNQTDGKFEFFDGLASYDYSHAVGGSNYGVASTLFFNDYLFFFFTGADFAPGFYFDGSAGGVCGYTGSGLLPVAGDIYNRRAYIIQAGEPAYWYSGIDSISGALNKVNLATVINARVSLQIIAPITISDNISTVTYQAFIFSNGQVFFYSGDFPDASNWGKVGQSVIGSPLGYGSGLAYQGDYLVFTFSGVVSLRDLFLKGSEDAASLTVNSNIQKTWQALATGAFNSDIGIDASTVKGLWDVDNNRILISFPGYLDTNGDFQKGSFFFVFFTLLQAWDFHRSFVPDTGQYLFSMIDGPALLVSNGISSGELEDTILVVYKEARSDFVDAQVGSDGADTIGYDFEIKSAPIPRGSDTNRIYSAPTVGLIRPGMVHTIQGMDVIIKSDLYAETNYYLIGDLGVTTAGPATTNAPEGSLQKPFVNIGSNNTYVQYKISGTTVAGKTAGLELYGTNVWLDQGDTPR